MNDAPRHAYEPLTPDVMLDALAHIGLVGDGRIMALSSYENRVVQCHLDHAPDDVVSPVVAKFYRPQRWSDAAIQEEHDFAWALADAEVPMVAPLRLQGATCHQFQGFRFSVSPRKGGRRPELDDWEVLEWIGRLMARLHNVGAVQPFAHRPALSPTTFGQASKDALIQLNALPMDVETAWLAVYEQAMAHITAAWAGFEGQHIRLHGDCHPGNILWTPNHGPHFVDLDDARSGPSVQDLWMLLSGDRAQQTSALSAVLEGYEQLRPFDRRELRLIEPLRTLRMIHYSAWLARRWDDPAFTVNFPWFGTSDYWHGQVGLLQDQIEAMEKPPLTV